MSTDVARLAMQIDVSGAQRARQALKGLQDGSIKAERATNTLIRSKGRLNQQSRATKNNLRGIALQLNQVAQQGALTGNFFQALAIQIPDLVVGMGPLGILLGGVAGGLATLAFSAKDAADATDTLRERVESLELSYRELTSAQKAALQLEFAAEERARQKQIKETEDRIKSLTQTMSEFRRGATVRRGPTGLAEALITPEQADRANESLVRLQGELDTLKAESKSAGDELDELTLGFKNTGVTAREATTDVESLSQKFKEQAETIDLSARKTALYELSRLAANGADADAVRLARLQINASFDLIEAYKREQEMLKATQVLAQDDPLLQRVGAQNRAQSVIEGMRQNAEQVRMGLDQELAIRRAHKDRVLALNDALRLGVINSAEERNRLEVESARQRNEQLRQLEMQKYELLNSGQDAFLSATSNLFGNLASIAEKGGKDQFSSWKAMASAQAAVSTALAVANALTAAPPPINFALAASVGALGAVQIAEIQSQEYQGSFLGGGYTGDGPRYGGIDGHGGFPAILHPDETVIDNRRGGSERSAGGNGGDTNITQVLQIPGNIQQEVKQQIMAALPLIRSTAINAVSAEINRGGNMARQVGRRS
ncbi:hypothetical protein MYE70_10710 [Marinobacter alexandrii]|uniref:hypothetical protein n=1 Tax=Marinobacter alexandrii TaxID=2570351 RepID=UPI001FFF17A8|nr:hypothetical protein [Marinobacter alexandrii]MCK2149537.1 hypothetical protein [Marinobacter alexandrii]